MARLLFTVVVMASIIDGSVGGEKVTLPPPTFEGYFKLICPSAEIAFSQLFFWNKINEFLLGDFNRTFKQLILNLDDHIFFQEMSAWLDHIRAGTGIFFPVLTDAASKTWRVAYWDCVFAFQTKKRIQHRVEKIPNSEQVLIRAAITGKHQAVDVLLGSGLERYDACAEDRFGKPICHLAAFNGHTNVVSTLYKNTHRSIDYLNIQDGTGHSPLMYAAVNNKPATVKFLIEKGVTLDLKENLFGKEAQHLASEAGHKKVMEVLPFHSDNVDVNAYSNEGYTSLMYAAKHSKVSAMKHISVVKYLLSVGADPALGDRRCSQTALHHASKTGNVRSAELLVRALQSAASVGALDAQDKYGYTALMWATRNNKVDVLKYLVDSGADLTVRDKKYNASALDIATKKNLPRCIAVLRKAHGIEEVAEEATSLVAKGLSYLSLVASVANELQFYPVKEGFEGPRPGFVFKMGERGLGYYTDAFEMATKDMVPKM